MTRTPTEPTGPPPAALLAKVVSRSSGSGSSGSGLRKEAEADDQSEEWEDWETEASSTKKEEYWSGWWAKNEQDWSGDWEAKQEQDWSGDWDAKQEEAKQEQDWSEAKQEHWEKGGIRRQAAPWAGNEKGHMANNARTQRVPGRGWVTDTGEKVWTHEQTGVTYASH